MGGENNGAAAENSERVNPQPISPRVSAFQGLLVALLALFIAAAAVGLFSIIQTGVQCEFKPVTYAIFTGIVLAAVGAALGGQAATNFSSFGIKATVTGGAAFLLIVMGIVWFATRSDCEPGPTLKLSSIPLGYAISRSEPTESPAYLRVRFDPGVRTSEYVDSNLVYSIFYSSKNSRGLSIYVDLIQGNKSAEICNIELKPAPNQLKKLLNDPDKLITLDRDQGGVFELKFRQDFVQDVLTKYHFEASYDPGSNACIQIDFFDPLNGHIKPTLVNEIYFTDPDFAERLEGISLFKGDLSSLLGGFKLYAVRAPQVPNAVSDIKNDIPVPAPVVTSRPPETPDTTCVAGNSPSATAGAALNSLKQTGVVSDDDVKALFENWCDVKAEFYDTLKSSSDSTLRYRLVRFIRTSTTAIDICWASNDSYRLKNATTTSCAQRLDRPRNLSRPLPFAASMEQKTILVGLLRHESLQVRHEVEILLRLYPHDDFGAIFKKLTATSDANSGQNTQTVPPAVVSYYYNRIIEQGWAESVEKANGITAELTEGLKWVDRLAPSDRTAARARLFYAKANALVQITGNKAPSPDTANQIKASFSELSKLSPDDLATYPYPHHLARALSFTAGSADEGKRFDTYNIDGFEHVTPPKTAMVTTSSYERSAWTLPDASSTEIRRLTAGETVRILMTIGDDPGAWQFVSTNAGLGWVKPKSLQN
jgi:hypothetical protein